MLLSVCVPTYNGGKSLEKCLEALSRAVNSRSDVEVIVSDNCSDDGITEKIISRYNENELFHLYRNTTNLGFNGNINVIINKYATGKYCWIIGDDDYLDIDAIDIVIKILNDSQPKLSFISVNHRTLTDDGYDTLKIMNDRHVNYQKGSYFQCLDMTATEGNVLGTFMSSQIFLLEAIKKFNLDEIGNNDWHDFRKTFPNSFMMTETFHDDLHCASILTPIFTAIDHLKNWEDKMYNIVMEVLPSYYDYCIKYDRKNKKKLVRTRKYIRKSQVRRNIRELKSGNMARVQWGVLCSRYTLPELYNQLLFKIKQISQR